MYFMRKKDRIEKRVPKNLELGYKLENLKFIPLLTYLHKGKSIETQEKNIFTNIIKSDKLFHIN